MDERLLGKVLGDLIGVVDVRCSSKDDGASVMGGGIFWWAYIMVVVASV